VGYRAAVVVIGLLALAGGFLLSAESRWDDQPVKAEGDAPSTTTSTTVAPTTAAPTTTSSTAPTTTEGGDEGRGRDGDRGGGDKDDD
jgi:hypothetical protein